MTFSNLSYHYGIESTLFGSSQKMNEVFHRINQIRQTHTPTLIYGENGTGKELVAHTIHQNSPCKYGEFVVVNCAATPSHLIERRLFGYEKVGQIKAIGNRESLLQRVDRGALFFREIDELHTNVQNKLLYFLKYRGFFPVGQREVSSRARIIATISCNLEIMREKKSLPKDLFDYFNILPIFMPPLRERMDDLEGLIHSILKQKKSKVRSIQPEALEILKSYRWPGNVSELKDVIEAALMVENSRLITLKSIPKDVQREALNHVQIDIPNGYIGPLDFDVFKAETEKEFIVKALQTSRGKINKTVMQANIPKNTLLRKIKKYNIDVKKISL